ncbi:hypothetical protein XF30_30625 [Bradyrhizobium sp. SUTN9-2]|uniref:hypothetical protein n=1 Tax=Bradyrhizobium sp. SUTN9-2 TaxID=1167456 RepID=UPI000D65CA78|nr:hypothetical protein [Bradyrhizobium sp. SUTN9-2]PWE80508.1 hypothetical protein XF30_30625 [Bradyrhizobium sp. SUTN9-2]
MKPVDYAAFVERTKQFAGKPVDEQRSIALYGLVSEIGSLVAAVKKKILSEGGEGPHWDQPNDEITEELGDSFWYCYSAAQVMSGGYVDILSHNITAMRTEIGGSDDRAHMIERSLDPANREAFLDGAAAFPLADGYNFDDYQRLAYKTARTDGRVLLEVCLALLWAARRRTNADRVACFRSRTAYERGKWGADHCSWRCRLASFGNREPLSPFA